MNITNLDIIAEYIIISHFQTRNTRFFAFPLLYLKQIVFSRIRNPAQFVQIRIHTVFNHSALIYQQRRIIINFPGNPVTNRNTKIQPLTNTVQTCIIRFKTSLFDRFDSLQSHFQLNHFTR